MPIIEASGLSKTYRVFQKKEGLLGALRGLFRREYKEVRAVDGVSFQIEPGEIVGFLGPNGAGKTTTLKMLSGLIYPTTGTAQVLGHVPWKREDAFRRRFALVMGQKNQLWWDLPAGDSFELHREIYSLPLDQFQKTLGELTELFGVGNLVRQPVRELSLGERMKMELIASLLHQPQLLLLDEPTIGLDVVAQVTILKCLRDYNVQRGVTILLTSHYMRDVEALCRRVLVITHGKMVYDGPLARIHEQFGQTKLVRLQFENNECPPGLERYGEVARREGPVADLKVERGQVPEVLAAILGAYTVVDMSVQDPPLDQVIAKVFESGSNGELTTKDT
ncbi:MAG: ATP-binding cassette domain-containing protein [Gemmataceae bacterium]|nr:ATP-binding cassette domain-containing protein [Gemmataceae bacterium]MCI0741453.1 ATP-binding cassette domain-containing protein [Gemmataceae bacterium]